MLIRDFCDQKRGVSRLKLWSAQKQK